MTDDARRTRLEFDWRYDEKKRVWYAKAGVFPLFVYDAYVISDWGSFHEYEWWVEIANFCRHEDHKGEWTRSRADSMLAAESWLAEAVREPAERLIAPPPPGQ